jgi:DNA-directed RNA polymerase subunit E'/Rpb7
MAASETSAIPAATTTLVAPPEFIPLPKSRVQKDQGVREIFNRGLFSRKIVLSILEIGENIRQVLEEKMKHQLEGKCVAEGYIKPDSVMVLSYSSGKCAGDSIIFEVAMEAMICFPVEGMLIECNPVAVTKAGIKAELTRFDPSPLVIFVARDHNYNNDYFNTIEEAGPPIKVRVIGQRFELQDTFISVIAEIIEPQA